LDKTDTSTTDALLVGRYDQKIALNFSHFNKTSHRTLL